MAIRLLGLGVGGDVGVLGNLAQQKCRLAELGNFVISLVAETHISFPDICINPIPYGISIPAMLRGGVFFTPPAKNILRSDRFKFLYTYQ